MDKKQVTSVLKNAHDDQHGERKTRGAIPENLSDELVRQLTPSIRTAIARKLISIATNGENMTTLKAIQEIMDRIEGRTRQQNAPEGGADSILAGLLAEFFKEDKQLYTAEYTVLPPLVD